MLQIPFIEMSRINLLLRVDRISEFMRFPEAVIRGALGYYWKREGSRSDSLYRLFWGDEVDQDDFGNPIATPPRAGRIVVSECEKFENCANLELTLFGKNENQIPDFIDSLQSIGREGIGKEQIRFDVIGESEIRSGMLADFLNPEPELLTKSCKLTIDAPMTLRQYGGTFLYDWDMQSFAANLVQRANQLNQFYGTGRALNWNVENLVSDFENVICWCDTIRVRRNRMSSRQHKHIDYTGFCGVVFMHNITRENYTLLRIGEQLAVGKNTVFGSGGYKLESV